MEPARSNQKLESVSKGRGCLVGVGVGAGPAGGSEEAIQREQLGKLGSGEGVSLAEEEGGWGRGCGKAWAPARGPGREGLLSFPLPCSPSS